MKIQPALRAIFGTVILLLLCAAAPCQGQVTIFAKFANGAGSWAGDVTRSELPAGNQTGWVRLDNFAVGFEHAITFPQGGGTSSGAVDLKAATFTKLVDRITPSIFGTLSTGNFLKNDGASTAGVLIVEFSKDTPAGPKVITRMEFKTVFFTTQNPSGSTGDDEVRETVQMVYGSTRFTVWTLNGDNTVGTPTVNSWNRLTNTSNFDGNP